MLPTVVPNRRLQDTSFLLQACYSNRFYSITKLSKENWIVSLDTFEILTIQVVSLVRFSFTFQLKNVSLHFLFFSISFFFSFSVKCLTPCSALFQLYRQCTCPIAETMDCGETGMNPVAMTSINPLKEFWPRPATGNRTRNLLFSSYVGYQRSYGARRLSIGGEGRGCKIFQ